MSSVPVDPPIILSTNGPRMRPKISMRRMCPIIRCDERTLLQNGGDYIGEKSCANCCAKFSASTYSANGQHVNHNENILTPLSDSNGMMIKKLHILDALSTLFGPIQVVNVGRKELKATAVLCDTCCKHFCALYKAFLEFKKLSHSESFISTRYPHQNSTCDSKSSVISNNPPDPDPSQHGSDDRDFELGIVIQDSSGPMEASNVITIEDSDPEDTMIWGELNSTAEEDHSDPSMDQNHPHYWQTNDMCNDEQPLEQMETPKVFMIPSKEVCKPPKSKKVVRPPEIGGSSDLSYLCTKCPLRSPKVFSRKDLLEVHEKLFHDKSTEVSTHCCQICFTNNCPYEWTDWGEFKAHGLSAHGIQWSICDICAAVIEENNGKEQMKAHLKLAHSVFVNVDPCSRPPEETNGHVVYPSSQNSSSNSSDFIYIKTEEISILPD